MGSVEARVESPSIVTSNMMSLLMSILLRVGSKHLYAFDCSSYSTRIDSIDLTSNFIRFSCGI